jgi:hypothetical protein
MMKCPALVERLTLGHMHIIYDSFICQMIVYNRLLRASPSPVPGHLNSASMRTKQQLHLLDPCCNAVACMPRSSLHASTLPYPQHYIFPWTCYIKKLSCQTAPRLTVVCGRFHPVHSFHCPSRRAAH